MSPTVRAIVDQARSPDRDELEVLVAAVQAMLDARHPDWASAWVRECENRHSALEHGETTADDADTVVARLRAKHGLSRNEIPGD